MPDDLTMATLTEKQSARMRYTDRTVGSEVPPRSQKILAQAAAVTGHSTLTSFVVFALQSSAQDHRRE